MKYIVKLISVVVFTALAAWGVWTWFFCRFYIPLNHMAVITSKTGANLPPGQILAKEGQKGIREDVLGEGRHFLNPVLYDWEIMPVTQIPPSKVGLVTSKIGSDLPPGEFLAGQGQKGIRRAVLGPGKYRINPYGFKIDVIDAVSVPAGYIGVITSLSGEKAPDGEFAGDNQKGVRRDILQPGLYYINPKEYTVDMLEVGLNQVSLLGEKGSEIVTKRRIATQNKATDELQSNVLNEQRQRREKYIARSVSLLDSSSMESRKQDKQQAPGPAAGKMAQAPLPQKALDKDSLATFVISQFVEFPSRDGFDISLDMTVEFELLPEAIAMVFKTFGDLPAVVDKIILPQILSVSRLKGSAYGAKDFIVGEGREKFQNDLTKSLASTLEERDIIIHEALIRHVSVPMEILDPIQQSSIAVEQDLTNKEMQNTARKQAELNTELGLIEQKQGQVIQETEKIKAETKADQEKQVAETRAQALKKVSEIEKETATVRAQKTRKLGEAEAKIVQMVEGEKANGQLLKAQAFNDPVAYSLWELASRLDDELQITILHSGEGTLWTDLEKARLGDLGGAAAIKKTGSGKDAKPGQTK
ncbi:MAG: SPFH domain-containing protein [Kiritimatiellia bacterium]